MAAPKRSTASTNNTNDSKDEKDYVWQHFTPKSIALIHKYNLQNDVNYKKLISSYERIESLPEADDRKINLVDLWETEFNRLFKNFWQNYSSETKKMDKGIGGWKDRLDVKQQPTSADAKRESFMSRLSVSPSATRNTKDEILNRAGYKKDTDVEQFNFTAQAKTGKNLLEIEALLNDAEDKGLAVPESMLSNKGASEERTSPLRFEISESEQREAAQAAFTDESDFTVSEPVPDPNLADFVNGTESFVDEAVEYNPEPISDKEYIASEDMTRQEFNQANNIQTEDEQTAAMGSDFQLGIEFFQSRMNQDNSVTNDNLDISPMPNMIFDNDLGINPEKRNILSKEGFEINVNEDKEPARVVNPFEAEVSTVSKPYHEVKPIGHYNMSYDINKRPSMQEIIESNEREIKTLDEMTEKIELLRELRNERRHRITMMKLERSNSYIVARARRMAEARDLERIRKRENINLRAIEKADRMRRLHERQRLIELMKERQIKRVEEKRVASVLRLERQRRYERDAKYRTEIASIDAQIRREQELIKRTELKMKAYFTKVSDDRVFDESLKVAKGTAKFLKLEEKAENVQRIEDEKRKNRVEKISRKFTKNVK